MSRAMETFELFGGLLVGLLVLFVPITLGIVLAQRVIGPARLERWLGGSNLPLALLKGAGLGAVTPFCGCSTVPLLLGLLKANVRFAAVAAFTLASPLLNPYILGVVTLLFGWQVAAGYTVIAFTSTVAIAALWEAVGLDEHVRIEGYRPARALQTVGGEGSLVAAATGRLGDLAEASAGRCGAEAGSCELGGATGEPAWRGLPVEVRAAWGETTDLLRKMLVPMLVGLGIGALLYGAVPEGVLTGLLGTSTWLTIPLAAALGLPLYLRGEAAFPIGAGLLAAGVGPGPMFAMVIAGMGASLPEVTLLAGVFRPRLLAAFLASVFAMAIAGGLLLPLLL